jgi:hypothetical protein
MKRRSLSSISDVNESHLPSSTKTMLIGLGVLGRKRRQMAQRKRETNMLVKALIC